MLMQGLSDKVKKRQAQIGDIVDTLTGEVVAPFGGAGIEIIPICMYGEWIVSKVVADKGGKDKEEFLRREALTVENEFLAFEDMEAGHKIRRNKQLNFFCLGAKGYDGLPYLISFRRMNYFGAGKNLATYFRMCEMRNIPPASKVYVLNAEEQVRNNNSFQVFTAKPGRASTKAEIDAAYMWYELLKTTKVKVADDEQDAAPVAPVFQQQVSPSPLDNNEVPF